MPAAAAAAWSRTVTCRVCGPVRVRAPLAASALTGVVAFTLPTAASTGTVTAPARGHVVRLARYGVGLAAGFANVVGTAVTPRTTGTALGAGVASGLVAG